MPIVQKLVDKRLIDRNLRNGLLNVDEYQKTLNGLVDCSDNIYNPESEDCDPVTVDPVTQTAAITEIESSNQLSPHPTVQQASS
jgi:hypothetical protein